MSRLPFNVLVLPYRLRAERFEYAVFHRSNADYWQFIAGGGEGQEAPRETARREAQEEGGISPEAQWIPLDSTCTIPRSVFPGAHWPHDLLVIPEHTFAVNIGDASLCLSSEHDRLEWLEYEAAHQRLLYDSNKNALWELRERLGWQANPVMKTDVGFASTTDRPNR